LSICDCKRSVW